MAAKDTTTGMRGSNITPKETGDRGQLPDALGLTVLEALTSPRTKQSDREARDAAEGYQVFQSFTRSLLVTITAQRDRTDPQTGEIIRGDTLLARFRDGHYRTNDPLVIKRLRSSPRFGVGKLYWSASDMKDFRRTAARVQVQKLLAANPEIVRELIPLLTQVTDDVGFDLPPVADAPAAGGPPPIPGQKKQ